MRGIHVVVGAGIVGSTLAELLANDGQNVIIITRSGSGPTHKNVKRVAADVSDLSNLLQIAPSAVAIYNCANPLITNGPKSGHQLLRAFLATQKKLAQFL